MNKEQLAKEAILSKIRANKHITEMVDEEPSNDPVNFIKDDPSGDLYTEFKNRISENKSIFIESSKENLINDINQIIKNEGVKNLIYPNALPFNVENLEIDAKFKYEVSVDEFRERIFEYDISVINARYAVSSHGICCCASSKDQPRLISLTPKVCVMLVKKEKIVKSISAALNNIKKEEGRLPGNVVFISGPSRTADIELTPVIGVHGSQIAYVIVY